MDRTITVFWDESFVAHEQPGGEFESEWTDRIAYREPHPDRPERIKNIYRIVQGQLSDHLAWRDVEPATNKQLERTHTADHIDHVQTFCANGGGRMTAETGANEHTYRAARHAAGAATQAAEHALQTAPENIPYAMVRPSGHHAQPEQVDGFCYFNSVAVAADHVLETTDVDRVAVIDWDVHHGNGTQECFYDRDDVLVISIHNDHWSWDPDAHPQTGDVDEVGVGQGAGYNVNVPLPPGTGDQGYEQVFDRLVDPVVAEYDPELILVSAGQDPGTVDPLGRNVVTKDGFEELGRRARQTAAEHASGNLALVQEGGYQVTHLAYATLGVLEGVAGVETGIDDPMAWMDEDYDSAKRSIEAIADSHAEYWPALD